MTSSVKLIHVLPGNSELATKISNYILRADESGKALIFLNLVQPSAAKV